MISGMNFISMPTTDWSLAEAMRKGSFLETIKQAEKQKALEQRTAEPTHSLTDEQREMLNSKYDFSTMQRSVRNVVSDGKGGYDKFTTYSEDYISFLGDLVYMNVYSADEITRLHSKPLPVHDKMQPVGGIVNNSFSEITAGIGQQTEEHIRGLEEMFAYYNKRSENPSQAVLGDDHFADTLSSLLVFNRQFFEMIKTLNGGFEDATAKLKEDFGNRI
ncbi:MAG: hypothetical protein NC401_17535 [Ruminococcus sp.]|nr:hypothetical protein [Ruminococcus sp.]